MGHSTKKAARNNRLSSRGGGGRVIFSSNVNFRTRNLNPLIVEIPCLAFRSSSSSSIVIQIGNFRSALRIRFFGIEK